MILQSLRDKGLISPPGFVPDNTHYLTLIGSMAYGVSTDTSDMDYIGFCIPPKNVVFPHLNGEIPGFGRQKKRFDQYQQHHISDPSAHGGKGMEYDITVYSIIQYFDLVMQNNPNMLDSLFAPADCVHHITRIGTMVRNSRKIFLHKGCFHKMRGYSFSQLSKMKGKTKDSKRYWMVEKYGYDIKFAYHVVRLCLEAEQILETGDLDIRRDSELIKSIRRGEWTEEQVRKFFTDSEESMRKLYDESTAVPHSPNEDAIKELLLNCLEEHYGSLADAVHVEGRALKAVNEIADVLEA